MINTSRDFLGCHSAADKRLNYIGTLAMWVINSPVLTPTLSYCNNSEIFILFLL